MATGVYITRIFIREDRLCLNCRNYENFVNTNFEITSRMMQTSRHPAQLMRRKIERKKAVIIKGLQV